MSNWQELLYNSVTDGRGLSRHLNCEIPDLEEIISRYPMRINPYFLSLIRSANDPLWKQAVPDLHELNDPVCIADPLAEEELSPVPLLVHKYPDRVLFLVSNQCAMYCRFCTRKRMVGTSKMHVTEESLQRGYDYIRQHPGNSGSPAFRRGSHCCWRMRKSGKSSMNCGVSLQLRSFASAAESPLPCRCGLPTGWLPS